MTELKNKIKLVGVDLDGTLLSDDKTLCDGAEQTIREATAHGIQIVPITGRPLYGVPQCIRNIEEIAYIICSNGAQIIDARTEESLYSFSVSNSKSREIIKILRSLDCTLEPFTQGFGYTEPQVYEQYLRQIKGTPLEEYIVSSRQVVDRIEDLFSDGERSTDDFFVSCATSAVRREMIDKIQALGGVQICCLGDRFAEITDQNADKGTALETICAHLGIDISSSMAFGDGENDLLFLEKAGVAVAMENAYPSVKEKADIIAKSNNDNGVCEIIKQLY